MMNHPKLLPSQELVLHQVSVDSFSPATGSVLKFPVSSLLPRSPFSNLLTVQGSASAVPCSPLSDSSTIAAPSIVRPRIRHRDEWGPSLVDVGTFVLGPNSLHTSSFDRRDPVSVRYIADKFDRAWLSRRPVLAIRRDDGVVSLVRGKTGGAGSSMPMLTNLSASVLEDTFTALELAAHGHPEVPLERLLLYARPFLGEHNACEEVLEELHTYWLLRRSGTGGLLPGIPNLRVTVREDNELALCHPSVLQDCPLPFKQRDWYVPVVERRRPSPVDEAPSLKCPRTEASPGDARVSSLLAQLQACEMYTEKAVRLSQAMLRREETRQEHMQLTLYELASLRSIVEKKQDDKDALEVTLSVLALSRCLTALLPPAESDTEHNVQVQ
ncbi:hypothetical protein LPMP_320070 [Leishmania panamensis]|uniref:Uncharacterized protein n=2 Tax=Leishmania guyanensis species complex TaxID=38579 RepID=A0A088RY71_LEIPA|nr:hypothetical protein LPMP_320070 [Leishmania panamensis]AIO00896.1 hypothetical protein LPMP_320070 [Leishmania panamensis]